MVSRIAIIGNQLSFLHGTYDVIDMIHTAGHLISKNISNKFWIFGKDDANHGQQAAK